MVDNNLFKSMDMIINDAGALVYVIDLESYEIVYANKKCIEEFGENIIGKTCYKVLQNNEDAPCPFCSLHNKESENVKLGDCFEWENLNSINGRYYLFNDRIALWDNNRKVKIQVGIDVTKQHQLQEELLREKNNATASFEALLDATIEAIFIFDKDKKCKLVNQVAVRLLGYEKEEMLHKRALDFIAPESMESVLEYMKNSVQEPYKAQMLRKDGTTFPALLRGHNVILAGEQVRVSAVIDMSEQQEYENKILQLAHYDILTSLPNRALLKEYISQAINRSKRTKSYHALLFIDLDNFKMVNDTVGHNIGDEVLVETARRLKSSIRKNDIVARLGGDEFVILIETNDSKKEDVIRHVAIIAQKILNALQDPYNIAKHSFRISASIGIKLFNDDELSMDALMKYADSAMYNAKFGGKNRFEFFNPEIQKLMEEKILLTENLRIAIEENNMQLYYQPQIFFDQEVKIVGVEALIRWIDPEKGVISPADFIPLAEESGLIVSLGEWILQEAVQQIKLWSKDKQKREWRVAVNVSSKQFESPQFVEKLESLLEKFQINNTLLMLELTEGILIKNIDATVEKLYRLKSLGLSMSIDDFGTGYSSLAYLKKLPMDELKIDKSFVDDITEDENDAIIIKTIISIGQKFGLDVIAEGVEREEQLEKLRSFGCKYFQGYFFAKPTEASLL